MNYNTSPVQRLGVYRNHLGNSFCPDFRIFALPPPIHVLVKDLHQLHLDLLSTHTHVLTNHMMVIVHLVPGQFCPDLRDHCRTLELSG
jgi:hypothetical protein